MQLLRLWSVLCLSLAFLVGVAIGTWGLLGSGLLLVGLLAGSALLGLGLSLLPGRPGLVVPILLAVSAVGVAAVVVHEQVRPDPLLTTQALEEQEALVVSAPEDLGNRQRAYVDLTHDGQTIRVRATWAQVEPSPRYGDFVTVSGSLEPPRQSQEFDERNFLRAHGSVGRLEVSSLVPTDRMGGSKLLRQLHVLRLTLLDRLDRAIDPPEAGIVAGITLGDRSSLDPTLDEAFRRTGTSHILVVSGANVLILAFIVQSLMRETLGRNWSVGLTLGLLLLFVIITGADASIIRAGAFYSFVLLALVLGRRLHALTTVTLVAALMVATNPWLLLYDIGFQLSFAAVLGLLWLSGWIASLLPGWALREYLAPTLAAQLTTLPVLIFHFGAVSWVSPLANALIGPFVPAIMTGGLAVLALPWLRVLSWAVEGATTVVLWIVSWLGSWPAALQQLPSHHLGWTLGSLGVLGLVVLAKRSWLRRANLETEGVYGE